MQATTLLALGLLLATSACASRTQDLTVGKPANTCELHGLRREKTKVPIEYGLRMPEPNYEQFAEARKARFPHAAEPVDGGCCVSDDMPLEAWIWACPECERERKRWILEFGEH